MNKLALLGVVVMVACQADNRNLEKKIEDLTKSVNDLKTQIGRGGIGAQMPQRPARAEPDRAKTYAIQIEGDPSEGPADAKVTLVKAYDYLCPFCERVRGTMDDLRKKYGNDLRIVYKQLVVHPPVATIGALAACAAHKQGKFLEMDKLLWDQGYNGHQLQKDGSENSGKCYEADAGCPTMLSFAQQLGLSADKFKADMKGECLQLVQKDQHELAAFGVGATPAFFVNGRYMVGAMPIDNFATLIDEELKKANDAIAAGTPAASYYQQVVLDKGLKQLDRPVQ